MKKLKKILKYERKTTGALKTSEGKIIRFKRKGVIDLYDLVTNYRRDIHKAILADRIFGKGAAFLAVKGGLDSVFSIVMSRPAYDLLMSNGIKAEYDTLTDNIINRNGDDVCPVEKLTQDISNSNEAFDIITDFLKSKNSNTNNNKNKHL